MTIVTDKFDQTSEVAESHKDQKNTCQYSGDNKTVHFVASHDTGDDRCKCGSWSGNLHTASTKSRDHETCYDCGENTGFRADAGGKCQCDRQRECDDRDDDARGHIFDKL